MRFLHKTIFLFTIFILLCTGSACDRQPNRAIKTAGTFRPLVSPNQNCTADNQLQNAVTYLISQQSEDGSWRSGTYGLLSSGQSLTPFVLYTLIKSQEDVPQSVVAGALEFMRKRINERGVLGEFDPDILEYPNYSTAYALMCFKCRGTDSDAGLIRRMQDYLISQQFCESNGFDATSPAYGGWGFGGVHADGETGHMDLAHTRRVLEALVLKPCDDQHLTEVLSRAQHFLRMVQKHPDEPRSQPMPPEFGQTKYKRIGFDGGFYFSPIVLQANKGRVLFDGKTPYWRSYATATCDGLLALIAADVPDADRRITACEAWLETHSNLDYPYGIPEDFEGENWRDAVHVYHLSVRAEVSRSRGNSAKLRRDFANQLAELQKPDGSFMNLKSALMKEDDPLLCTALAIITLAE